MKHFVKTTTLHGFKYLCAKCYYDRAGWAVGCLASACCAAVLCTVVWARYLQMPALLTLRELRAHHASVLMPLVAVCPPADTVATLMARRLVDIPVPKRSQLEINKVLTLALQCSDEVSLYNCDFFTKYDVEEWVEPFALIPGFSYEAQLTFTSVSDSDESGMSNLCVYHQNFSKSKCLLLCMEERCGCLDPLRLTMPGETLALDTCHVQKLNCLRHIRRDDPQCNCLPPCKKVTTGLALVPSKMNALNYSVNPLIAALNNTLATLLTIQVRISGSRMFVVNPTETWITLLSSIGGIFNMFLGVGFFSVVELLFLFLLRLPIAFRRSSEIEQSS
ncbi:uncharacterized protein LOC126977143 [Leptidea sinapis]|uniref:uncharacterized protein LOC126977143 n=1 Tax=Leptidea sinapis TaxID=189913 RepID=UPI0021C31EDA|nr:uncharacterized protein LOC126977143 [Leptidea sinapis]